MVLIFSSQKSLRLQYILRTLFDALGLSFEFTDNEHLFKDYKSAKVNYSTAVLCETEIHISPVQLLFESNLTSQSINCFQWREMKVFFASSGDLPFDIFAASFYLLTRYEEYLPHTKDDYGRYAHTNSLAFKEGFLHLPLVNLWLQELVSMLKQKYPQLILKQQQFRFIPTYDVDMAWSYFSKGWLRNLGGLVKSLLNGDWAMVEERLGVLIVNEDDPFDVYEWLDGLHEKHALIPVYFFLLAQKKGRYDKNINPRRKYYRLLIKKLAVMYATGVHPSWQSGDKHQLLKEEIELLRQITGKTVINSRQHYIRMTLPESYQHLLTYSINNDYSLGYGSINGFRASYCLPYQWYDLSKEDVTGLTIHPFCYMEANSLFEQYLSPNDAFEELQHYYAITKQVNGTLITIFHNHLLTLQPMQVGWRQMYETFLSSLTQKQTGLKN